MKTVLITKMPLTIFVLISCGMLAAGIVLADARIKADRNTLSGLSSDISLLKEAQKDLKATQDSINGRIGELEAESAETIKIAWEALTMARMKEEAERWARCIGIAPLNGSFSLDCWTTT